MTELFFGWHQDMQRVHPIDTKRIIIIFIFLSSVQKFMEELSLGENKSVEFLTFRELNQKVLLSH